MAREVVAIDHFPGGAIAPTDRDSLNLPFHGGRVRIVYWAWSLHADRTLDPAFLVTRLIAASTMPPRLTACRLRKRRPRNRARHRLDNNA